MGDHILLTGIGVHARHGVYDSEKTTDQLFVIDLDCVLRRASLVDDLDTTVDYSTLASDVVACVRTGSVDLIETLAERIAEVCLAHRAVDTVTVTVHKPEAPLPVGVVDVAVRLTRGPKA
ncbi:MAG TPA: dihydroneopterin aldolase [Propionicimonas sp.]|jgi:dihydroneopterin aldolase|nr:dihydroneopterin aldolase [Propionicimonas sp.]